MQFLHTGWYLEILLSVQRTEVKKLSCSREFRSQEAVSAPGHHAAAGQWGQGLHRSPLWREGLWGPADVPKLQVITLKKKPCLQCTERDTSSPALPCRLSGDWDIYSCVCYHRLPFSKNCSPAGMISRETMTLIHFHAVLLAAGVRENLLCWHEQWGMQRSYS